MNYLKIYETIITNAKNRKKIYGYSEKHHIIPKSLFKSKYCEIIFKKYYINIKESNDKANLVKLTLREHYICHLLLVRIFENNKNCNIKMLYASNFITNRINNNRVYEWQKKELYDHLKKTMTGKPSKAKGTK